MLFCRMSQVEALLLHQMNLLATAVVLLVIFLAAAIGTAAAFAQAWSKASSYAGELRSWYRGHSQQKAVEGLVVAQAQRDMMRRKSQPVLPSGTRQREPEPRAPKSSKPLPLDTTWTSIPSPELIAESSRPLAEGAKPLTPRPPPLPEPAAPSAEPDDWSDSDLKTEQVTDSMLLPEVPANDDDAADSEPLLLTQKPLDKLTWVWPQRKLPRIE